MGKGFREVNCGYLRLRSGMDGSSGLRRAGEDQARVSQCLFVRSARRSGEEVASVSVVVLGACTLHAAALRLFTNRWLVELSGV